MPKDSHPRLSHWHITLVVAVALLVTGALYLRRKHVPRDDTTVKTELIVLQLNDVYRLDAVRDGKRGGMARVAAVLRQIKAENPTVPVIVLHAGDFLGPSLESKIFHGAQMIDSLNYLNSIAPVYVVPGNHEFDYEEQDRGYLSDAINKSQFQWLASNLERNDPGLLPELKDRVTERFSKAFGGVKVGIFALTLDSAQRGKDRSYAPISNDYEGVAKRQIELLEQDGADIIIGLTHLDIGDDRKVAKLRSTHPRFRWIAGGHEHSLDRDAGWSGGTLITKGDSNARTIWKISVMSRGRDAEVLEQSITIDQNITGDPTFARELENFYRDKLKAERPYLDEIIATQSGLCYDATEEAVRTRESNWGSFLADNMRKPYSNITADIAVLNGGSIRLDDTFCDRIKFEHLERTFAYDSPIVLVKLSGKNLKEQIFDSYTNTKRGDGRFLQVSGVGFRRELTPDGKNVITDLKVRSPKGDVPLNENQAYIVAVPKFLFNCGDGYKFREYVSEYVPAGPDLRNLTYGALLSKMKTNPSTTSTRITDLPAYAKPVTLGIGKWESLAESEKRCPKM